MNKILFEVDNLRLGIPEGIPVLSTGRVLDFSIDPIEVYGKMTIWGPRRWMYAHEVPAREAAGEDLKGYFVITKAESRPVIWPEIANGVPARVEFYIHE